MKFKYRTVAIAGTFDRLHLGHRYFIQQSFKFGDKVLIGLTSDPYVKEKVKSQKSKVKVKVNNFEFRKKDLEDFLRVKKLLKRAQIVKINDVYGPSIKKNEIEALVITDDTQEGAEKVNKRRRELGFTDLEIIKVPLINADDNKRISSTRIRLGEIDRWGRVFEKSKWFGGKISEQARTKLKRPLGQLISGTQGEIKRKVKELLIQSDPVVLVSVGDEATLFFNLLNYSPDIAVVDFFIKRKRVHNSLEELEFPVQFFSSKYKQKIINCKNPAGYITQEMVVSLKKAIERYIQDGKKRVIKVDGEEDLAGVPAILLTPLGSMVFYGQPDEGIVAVRVSEDKKKEILNMES